MKAKYFSPLLLVFLFSCNQRENVSAFKKQFLKIYAQSEVKQPDSVNLLRVNEAFKYLETGSNDSVTRNLYFKTALKYYNLNDYNHYLQASRKVLQLAQNKKDSAHTAKAFCYIGEYFDDQYILDSAFYYYNKSNKLYRNLKDSLNTGRTILYKAGILYEAGNYAESEVESINALKLLNKQKNTRLIYEANLQIGLCLKGLNNFESSTVYFNRASELLDVLELEKYDEKRLLKSRITCSNNIGSLYERQKEYGKAIPIFEEQLKIKNLKTDFPKIYAMLFSNLAYCKMKTDNSPETEKMLFEALNIRIAEKSDIGIASSKLKIGEYYIKTKDTVKAKHFLEESFTLAKKVKGNFEILESLRLLTDIDSQKKTYYSDLYFATNDSIQNLERLTRNKFARIAYETDLVTEENEILTKRNLYILVFASFLVLVTVIVFFVGRLREKNRTLAFNEMQRVANEKIYELMLKAQIDNETAKHQERDRIAMELHDGIINNIFTTRFNLSILETTNVELKEKLVNELQKTESEVRQISHDLKQKLFFEDNKLTQMLKELVEKQKGASKIVFDIMIDKQIDWSQISSHKQIHLYRVVQEVIQNVNKHSKSEICDIFVMKTGRKITTRIIDKGVGYDARKTKDGIGIKNIKSRVKKLDGTLQVDTAPGNGTIIEVVF